MIPPILRRLKFWAELVVALGGTSTIGISMFRGWYLPSMPAWLGFSVLAGALVLGFVLGHLRQRRSDRRLSDAVLALDHRDFFPLEERGWKIRGDEGTTSDAVIEPKQDRRFGTVVVIDLPEGVYLQRALPEASRVGRHVEFVGKMGSLYVRLLAQRPSFPNPTHVWLQFSPGDHAPRSVSAGEWALNVHAAGDIEGSSVYRIDIGRAFSETFGRSGVTLVEITDLRFRGRSVVARITISATMPVNKALAAALV